MARNQKALGKRSRLDDDVESARKDGGMTLTDSDVLDCPICFQPLRSPVNQCENGHISCFSCCTKMERKCASCRRPLDIRCRAIEKVIEAVKVPCQYASLGCKETNCYGKQSGHEKACPYSPCSCPYTGCKFVGSSKCLYKHFAQEHPYSYRQFSFRRAINITMEKPEKHFYLLDNTHDLLFVLCLSEEPHTSFLRLICISPPSENSFSYELTLTVGESSIKLKTSVDFMTKWSAQTTDKMGLMVPSNVIDHYYELELTIRKNVPAPAS